MDEIRPWLYIGIYRDALNPRFMEDYSIQAMIHLAENVTLPGVHSLFLQVEDLGSIPADHIETAVHFIKDNLSQNRNILITCGAGINRSTAFCVVALKEVEGLGLLEAYKEVRKRHRDALPNKYVWESLCEYYDEKVPYLEIMKAA